MKSATMISWELDPFLTRGGTAYAIRRLADQLTAHGVETKVLLPDCLDQNPENDGNPLLNPVVMKTPAGIENATRGVQCSEFVRCALAAFEQEESDVVIAHSLEGALFTVLQKSNKQSVFWLHSLYDPDLSDLPKHDRKQLPKRTLLASAVSRADIVVTSLGIMEEASEFEWPEQLEDLRKSLLVASDDGRILTVESTGCLPSLAQPQSIDQLSNIPTPYVLFPGRSSVDKGLGIFATVARRLESAGIACVAVRRPVQSASSEMPGAPIHWLPWLGQAELVAAMRGARCTVLPSITEGFGLAAAESISHGFTTLYQAVGGHRSLPSLPNSRPVPITPTERECLYRLWAELFASKDYWSTWTRYEGLLTPLIDRWVDAIQNVVDAEPSHPAGAKISGGQWATKLLQRIEPSYFVARA